jgi:hypothetical protein
MENKKIEVGQKVWVKKSALYRNIKEPFEAVVLKVGKKYFEVDRCPHKKFFIDTLYEHTEGNYVDRIYLNPQEIADEKELLRLSSEIRRFFSGYGEINLTLDKLVKISEIINEG